MTTPIFGGAGGALSAGLDLPQAIVTSDEPPAGFPGDDCAHDEAPPAPIVNTPVKTAAAAAAVTRPAAGGRVRVAESRGYVALTEAPFPREEWFGVPIGAPNATGAHSMMIYAAAAGTAELIAERGQIAAGAAIGTTPIVIPVSGAWVRITAAATVHAVVFGY